MNGLRPARIIKRRAGRVFGGLVFYPGHVGRGDSRGFAILHGDQVIALSQRQFRVRRGNGRHGYCNRIGSTAGAVGGGQGIGRSLPRRTDFEVSVETSPTPLVLTLGAPETLHANELACPALMVDE